MGSNHATNPVKLFIDVLTVEDVRLEERLEERLISEYGPLDHRMILIPSDRTIHRVFFSFDRLIEIGTLPKSCLNPWNWNSHRRWLWGSWTTVVSQWDSSRKAPLMRKSFSSRTAAFFFSLEPIPITGPSIHRNSSTQCESPIAPSYVPCVVFADSRLSKKESQSNKWMLVGCVPLKGGL